MDFNLSLIAEYFHKGGPFMYPILLCSIVSVTIFLYKFWTMRDKNIMPEGFLRDLYGLLVQGKLSEAAAVCSHSESSIARIAVAALAYADHDKEELREEIEEAGKREVQELGRYIEGLGAISNVSTLLGLLGTISGMIKIFNVISQQTIVDPQKLAGGISEALYTTAFGLAVAIPTYLVYKYYSEKLEDITTNLELEGSKIADYVLAATAPDADAPQAERELGGR